MQRGTIVLYTGKPMIFAVPCMDPADFKSLLVATQNCVRALEFDFSVHALPMSIGPGGAIMSPVCPSFDLPKLTAAAISNQAGSMTNYRYLDRGGAFLPDSVTATMTANTACSIALSDGKFCSGVQLKISNSNAAAPATLSSIFMAISA